MTDISYISTKEAAGIMDLSTRRVVGLCNAGKLEGALRKGRILDFWLRHWLCGGSYNTV